ncbi:hypothetical protein [Streptomyces sp. NBC_00316]|uniref:hypothetical protein n=1 Tax=Streptomyces sp. NBC_00316 TaxID=2975710 RepID=UPI002E2B40F2|nr:hypothetical protein [Streptomyces sp. NBC_00316]
MTRRFLPELARHAPLLPGADHVAHVDIDDTIRRAYGYAKQGAGYGYSKVKGLNALLGIASTELCNGFNLSDDELRTRSGYTREEIRSVLGMIDDAIPPLAI